MKFRENQAAGGGIILNKMIRKVPLIKRLCNSDWPRICCEYLISWVSENVTSRHLQEKEKCRNPDSNSRLESSRDEQIKQAVNKRGVCDVMPKIWVRIHCVSLSGCVVWGNYLTSLNLSVFIYKIEIITHTCVLK